MPAELDVYRDWLGIAETKRPLNYYELLRLKKFEDDPVRIRANYRKLNAHVRKYAAGDFARQSQELLNELAKAMLCLTDSARKNEYDASLGRVETGSQKRRTFEELLLLRKVVDQAQLNSARDFAQATGMEMQDALVQQKLTKPEIAMQVYAESLGLPYIDLAETGVDMEWVPKVPALLARQHSCVPVMVDGGQLLMASPRVLKPDVEDDLRLRLDLPVRSVLCTAQGVNAAITRFFPKEAAQAEMAAGTHTPPAAKPKTKSAAATKEDAAEPEKPRLAPHEAKKVAQRVALLSFNFCFMGTVFAMRLLPKIPPSFLVTALAAAVVGAIGGGIGYVVGKSRA